MIIDGKKIADEVQQEIKEKLSRHLGRKPCLAVIIVGNHLPSKIYINRKTLACEQVGILSFRRELSENVTEHELLKEIHALNENPSIDGILVQLPLPHHINPTHVIESILPEKDVDGFHPTNVGKLLIGAPDGFTSCTPLGIKTLLERSKIEVAGKHAVVLGRSNIVGKPMAAILMQSTPGGNATVTVAHRLTPNLPEVCRMGDILIAAIGQPLYIKEDMVKQGAVVIDVGINKIASSQSSKGYEIVGDVDFNHVKNKCSFITPVPGGVGPMTIAMLLHNTLLSYERRMSLHVSHTH